MTFLRILVLYSALVDMAHATDKAGQDAESAPATDAAFPTKNEERPADYRVSDTLYWRRRH